MKKSTLDNLDNLPMKKSTLDNLDNLLIEPDILK